MAGFRRSWGPVRPIRAKDLTARSWSSRFASMTSDGYAEFIASKRKRAGQIGRDCEPGECHPMLHDWQAEAVAWAVRTGRAAIFWDCGLGKTFAQLEWARLSADTALILAPLSVARQTVREARKIDLDVRLARHGDDVTGPGLWITNYEMVHHFDMTMFGALVLDESSILKNVDGKTRKFLTAHAADVPLRLACSNEGETVLSPFAGIGSEGVVSLKHGRRFVGCELKPSYWKTAAENLRAAEGQTALEMAA